MENLLPEFKGPKTYHGFNIPLIKTQIDTTKKTTGNNNNHNTITSNNSFKKKSSNTNNYKNSRRRNKFQRYQPAIQFRRPFDAVRLQPSLGKEPRNRGITKEHKEAGKIGGWKFHTAGPSIYEYEYDGRRGRLEYDGYEEATEALKLLQPALQRGKMYRRELSHSPPRLTQAAIDAIKIDYKNISLNKPSTAPAGATRQVYRGVDGNNNDNDDDEDIGINNSSNDNEIFSSSNKNVNDKKKSRRPATATGTLRRRSGRVGINEFTTTEQQQQQRPKWGSRRGKFQPRFNKVPELNENGMTVSSKLPSGDSKKKHLEAQPPTPLRIFNLQPTNSTFYFSTAKGNMKVLHVRAGYSLSTTTNLLGERKITSLLTQEPPPMSHYERYKSKRRPVSAAASRGNQTPSVLAENYLGETSDGLTFAIAPRSMLKKISSKDDDVECTIKFSNHDIEPFQIFWINYDGQRHPRMLLRPGDSYVESSFSSHPWFIQRGNSENAEGLCITLGDLACKSHESYSVVYNPPNHQWRKSGKISLSVTPTTSSSSRPNSANVKRPSSPASMSCTINVAIVPSFKL